jgi:hypothetical protein
MSTSPKQADVILARISLLTRLINKEEYVIGNEETKHLIAYFNSHTLEECNTMLIDLADELERIYVSHMANPYSSPMQITINMRNTEISAYLIRVSKPRLILCQDRVMQVADNGTVEREIDLLHIFGHDRSVGSVII